MSQAWLEGKLWSWPWVLLVLLRWRRRYPLKTRSQIMMTLASSASKGSCNWEDMYTQSRSVSLFTHPNWCPTELNFLPFFVRGETTHFLLTQMVRCWSFVFRIPLTVCKLWREFTVFFCERPHMRWVQLVIITHVYSVLISHQPTLSKLHHWHNNRFKSIVRLWLKIITF